MTRAQAARARWEAKSPAEQAEHVARMQAGRSRLSTSEGRAERLAEVEQEMSEVGAKIDALREAGEPVPWKHRDRLRSLANRRLTLKYGGSNEQA